MALGIILGLLFRFMKISISRDPSKDAIKPDPQENEDDWEDDSDGYEDESDQDGAKDPLMKERKKKVLDDVLRE